MWGHINIDNEKNLVFDILRRYSKLRHLSEYVLKHNVTKFNNIDNSIVDIFQQLKQQVLQSIDLYVILEACETGNADMIALLIELNYDLNIKDYAMYPGFSLLHIATCYLHVNVCRLLLANKVNIDIRDNFGRTALHWACHFGTFDIVKLIIEKSIINVADYDGNTPLYLAANAGHEKIVTFLIQHGASLTPHNKVPRLIKNYSDGHYIVDEIIHYIHNESTTIDGKAIAECRLFLGNDSLYKGQLINGKMEGIGILICATGKYEGEFKDGEINGIGKLTMVNGNRYEGEFKNGEMCGNGKYIWLSGNTYEGNFVDGEISGIGKFVWVSCGERYEGEFIDGEICGNGMHVNRWNYEYLGAWLDGERHGYGVQTYKDGKYEGEWTYNHREGWGKFIYANKDATAIIDGMILNYISEGEYKNDTMTGKGKIITINSDVYEGDIINHKAHGNGRLIWKDGCTYEGDFVDNKYHGQGKFTWADGNTYEGSFLDGKITGTGKIIFFDSGDIYEGEVLDKVMHGKGKLTCGIEDGRIYEGDFINGKRTGQGILIWPNGDTYQGGWLDNHIIGFGINRFVNGVKYIGDHIVDNIMTGEGVACYAGNKIKAGYFKDGSFIKPFCMDE